MQNYEHKYDWSRVSTDAQDLTRWFAQRGAAGRERCSAGGRETQAPTGPELKIVIAMLAHANLACTQPSRDMFDLLRNFGQSTTLGSHLCR